MLEIGHSQPLHIRHENIEYPDQKANCHILYISDIHLRNERSRHLCKQMLTAANDCHPDVILLGGDLVDRLDALPLLCELLQRLQAIASVGAVPGNHDQKVGLEQIRTTVKNSGASWLCDRPLVLHSQSHCVSFCGTVGQRQKAEGYRVLVAHNPRIFKKAEKLGFDLVLAGHLHGCQCVIYERNDFLYPGALFYPFNALRLSRGRTKMLISRGVTDLIPIRWRCPREVLLYSL